jgi:hypothetical protein
MMKKPFRGPAGKNSLLERRPLATEKNFFKMRKMVESKRGSVSRGVWWEFDKEI